MTDTIEKVARALFDNSIEGPEFDQLSDQTGRQFWVQLAKAAIAAHVEALMEPTEEMEEKMIDAFWATADKRSEAMLGFQAMLRAAQEARE